MLLGISAAAGAVLIGCVWLYCVYTVLNGSNTKYSSTHVRRPVRVRSSVSMPERYAMSAVAQEPASLDEIRANMTAYLNTLHAQLRPLKGAKGKGKPSRIYPTYTLLS